MDVDLTLQGGAELTLEVLNKIIEELDDLLLPYTIDRSILANIHDPELLNHFQRVGVTFYTRDVVQFEVSTKNEILNKSSLVSGFILHYLKISLKSVGQLH